MATFGVDDMAAIFDFRQSQLAFVWVDNDVILTESFEYGTQVVGELLLRLPENDYIIDIDFAYVSDKASKDNSLNLLLKVGRGAF